MCLQRVFKFRYTRNMSTGTTSLLAKFCYLQHMIFGAYSGLSIQVLLYIQWSLNTGSTVHTVVSQYRFYCTYSGLSIQVLLYIQWSLNTGSTVHTVVSQYRFYCTYSGLSIQVLLYIQWSLSTGSILYIQCVQ